jgi:integrative and conjugative element protein (TIGR02256 family)
MIYRHVFIVRSALATIRKEVRRARFTETGGPLTGYISEDHALVVTHAAGPGPRATLRPFSVVIDGTHAQQFCDKVRRRTGGRLDYVGDWHRHLGWSLKASPDDRDAMRTMAAFDYCPVRNPASLIYRSLPEDYVVYILNDKKMLEANPVSVLKAIPRGTDAQPAWNTEMGK